MHEQNEDINKVIENMEKNQLGAGAYNNPTGKFLDESNNRHDWAEEPGNSKARHLKLSKGTNEKKKKRERMKKSEESLRDLWTTIKHTNIHPKSQM